MIRICSYIILVSLVMLPSFLDAQNGKPRNGRFALTGATINTVTKGIITNGTVLIEDGKISAVGTNVAIPQGTTVLDCSGQWIYPGMINGGTRIGLLEIGQIPQASDQREKGEVVPQMKALTAVNPNSAHIPVTRVNGVTTVLAVPDGGLFPGTAALIDLHGYTSAQLYRDFEGVLLNFPVRGRRGAFDRRTDEEIKKTFEKDLAMLNDVWDKAMQFYKLDSATQGKDIDYYPEMLALLPVIQGKIPVMIEVNAAKDIQAALQWAKERKLKKVILTGVSEGWRVADEIAGAGHPVITGPVLEEPTRDYDRYDRPYANAGLMHKAGVKVALRTMSGTGNDRNLPYHAGFAAAYGLGKEEALKAVTITAAEIFGVQDKLGSIEAGKHATLLVCNGDPFETQTILKYVFINGWQMPMTSRQTELHEEFLLREPGVKK
ncbi:MAG TPA: amidohydrolase family protein [Ohtaekwangia sp.]|nr:amidohydrolase family protein [Ohtaekwangia sp.]